MPLEWSRLRIFDAVARTGSVTRAAEILHLTGPAVSQQLRRIESEVGTPIVAADGRGLRLTEAGRTLAGYAREVSELMQQAENDLSRPAEPDGTVRIGAIASVIRDWLTVRLSSVRDEHPTITVTVEDGETDDHLESLTNGRLDLVVAESWDAAPLPLPVGVMSTRLFRRRALAALPAGHPLSPQGEIDLRDLADDPWSTCARGSRDHAALVQTARSCGIELDIRHFVADLRTQQALVAQGLAVACLPFAEQPTDEEGVVYRSLVPAMHRSILLLTSDRTLSRAVAAVRSGLSS